MPNSILSINNNVENNLSFTVDDRFFLGEGLFETMRVVNQQVIYADLHWQRLGQSALQ